MELGAFGAMEWGERKGDYAREDVGLQRHGRREIGELEARVMDNGRRGKAMTRGNGGAGLLWDIGRARGVREGTELRLEEWRWWKERLVWDDSAGSRFLWGKWGLRAELERSI
ncbi:unnamed protein product [Calypogeia fissa]